MDNRTVGPAVATLDECARVAAVHRLGPPSTVSDADLDAIAALASASCRTAIGAVSLIDDDSQWLVARTGTALSHLPRALSICGGSLYADDVVEIPDAAADPRYAGHPLVAGGPRLRFYAAVALRNLAGHPVGTLCVIDPEPRHLTDDQRTLLRQLGRHAAARFDLRDVAFSRDAAVSRADQALRLQHEFLGTIGHELRTPLTSVQGYASLLADAPDLPIETVLRFVEAIRHNSRRLVGLVEDLMLLAQLRSSPLALSLDRLDLAEVTRLAARGHESGAADKRIDLVVDVDRPAYVHADRARLHRAIAGLVDNAVKFTPRGGRVEVVTSTDPRPTVEVADTGIGIAAPELTHVFDPFYRAANARTDAAQGGGMGLSIVKAIVEAHRGCVSVNSEPGSGSRFRISLPEFQAA